ncbi:MAG: hypothetical protein JKZ03_06300, partial [Flavobacteriaceae bacterium]|nr:hypothetical protein [Flavobacteriaceae bacterium]
MKKTTSLTASLMALFILGVVSWSFSQDKKNYKPTASGLITHVVSVPSLAEQMQNGTFIYAPKKINDGKEINPKLRHTNKVIPGKGFPKGDDPLVKTQEESLKIQILPPSLVFDADIAQATPTDATGGVGPNHYLGGWNVGFRIFDKSGNPLIPEASLTTIFPGNDLGDPIMLYDALADRFIITEFDDSPNGFNIAISKGPDPVNDGWHVYTTEFGTSSFPDYPKFSIWPDGYYITANIGSSDRVFVMERLKMLNGEPAQFAKFPLSNIATSGFYSPQFFNLGNATAPASGNATVVYMQDDAWFGVSDDHLKLWTVNMDWNTIDNSTISSAVELITGDFTSVFDGGSLSNLTQPSGPDIDALQATIMNQAQFRKFPTHNSAVFNFVVDTDGTAGKLAGIRWFELRQNGDGQPWTIFQEGTYISPAGGKHAFAASMAMDNQGNIGMGYSTLSNTESIAIQYTGRFANDASGTMSIDETLIKQGSGNSPSDRYTDYTHLTVDPTDDQTFWHIAEYFNPERRDVVGVFKIAPDAAKDVGVVSIDQPNDGILTATETVEITIRNFGTETQSSFQVSFNVDGGTNIIETFTGSIASTATATYTFTGTADLSVQGTTYTINAITNLTGDENSANDDKAKQVTHLQSNDVGVLAITAPSSSMSLGATEAVIISIKNFGGLTQTSIPVFYTINGGAKVSETFTGSLAAVQTTNYTFNQTADLSVFGSYNFEAGTELSNDSNLSNNNKTKLVKKQSCTPEAIDGCNIDGLKKFILGTINADDGGNGCNTEPGTSPMGYADRTDLTTDLDRSTGNNTHILQAQHN